MYFGGSRGLIARNDRARASPNGEVYTEMTQCHFLSRKRRGSVDALDEI